MRRIWLLVVVMFALFIVVACETDEEIQQSIQESGASAISVSSATLYADYDANQISADLKYKDRVVLVTGTVDSVGENFMGDATVTLTDGTEFGFGGVECSFADSNRSDLAAISKGQTVTLRGGIVGFNGYSAGVIDVWWCTIENS